MRKGRDGGKKTGGKTRKKNVAMHKPDTHFYFLKYNMFIL